MVEEILENLIGQFSDPLTFYRELIQNALDAGARSVQITVTRRADPPGVVVEVCDWGEGMNRRIIAEELTRLFSSNKEEDLTKIGKFGIGFVSVFAIQPDMVVVDTGRDGESWRIVFDGSATYQCLRLEEPIEGTRVRLFKSLSHAEYDDFVVRSLASVRYWCRFSDTPIHFNGQPINEELAVDSPLVVRHVQPGTEVVVGLQAHTPTPYGLYNRGLTLAEGVDAFWPGLAFRLKSRYLEHTLTRDSVLRDKHYEKAMQILRTVARVQLPAALLERVAALLAAGDGAALDTLFGEAVLYLGGWRKTLPRTALDSPLFPTVHGPPLSLQQLRRTGAREGGVYIESGPNQVTEALWQVGVPVLLGAASGGLAEAAAAVGGYVPQVASRSVAAPGSFEDAAGQLTRVVPLLMTLLRDARVVCRQVALADFDYLGSSVSHLACLMQPVTGGPIRLNARKQWWRGPRYGRLLLNRTHPLVEQVLLRGVDAPMLAAFVLVRSVVAPGTVPEWLEARWIERCVATRPRLEEGWFNSLRMRLWPPRKEPV